MAIKSLTVLSVAATIVGAGATLMSNWVAEQKMDAVIDEKVKAAINSKSKKNKEEEPK